MVIWLMPMLEGVKDRPKQCVEWRDKVRVEAENAGFALLARIVRKWQPE